MSEWLSVAETAQKIAFGELSAAQVADRYLERIGDVDKRLNAYLTVDAERR
jgi:aspartyl-tRNA(Asn)/glutamyl-tRNA(Gln) amidotransferase subunit A